MALVKPYTFSNDTDADADEVNANFDALFDWVNNQSVDKSGQVAFEVIPSGPPLNPTSDNQFARKKYVDEQVAGIDSKIKRGSTTVTLSGSSTEGLGSKTVSISGINNSWLVFAQVRQSGTYAAGVGCTITSRSGSNVTFTVWTRSGQGVSATYTVDYVAISPN